jgi:hypothetical protein
MDPWKARAFVPLTHKHVFAILPPRNEEPARVGIARQVVSTGVLDHDAMRAAHVNVFYGLRFVGDVDLRPAHDGVWVWCDPLRTFATGPCA